MKTDFLIIGQGLAGTLLSWNLLNEGAEVLVVDGKTASSASKTSAGIVNPLTGRQFALSWEFEKLFEEAARQYGQIEEKLQSGLFEKTLVSRAVMQTKGLNDLLMRLEVPSVAKWIQSMDNQAPWPELLNPAAYYVHIHGARLKTDLLLQKTEEYLSKEGRFVKDSFDFADVQFEAGEYRWKGIRAKQIVWCGGVAAPDLNLKHWPVIPLKGQVLRIRIPGFSKAGIVKHHIFLAGEGSEIFWAGATHEPNVLSPEKDEAGFAHLKSRLDEMIKLPWEVISHEAALRPTVKDRRPILGVVNSGEMPFFVFSGLGTKGASLAPQCAKWMTAYLLEGKELPKTVDINRF